MRPRFCGSTVAILVALAATACGVASPSQNQTETFSHTIQPGPGNNGGAEIFSTSKSGEVSVTVTRFDPPVNVFFSVGYYQNTSNGCALLQRNDFAVVGRSAISDRILPGSYCVAVFDQGFFTVPETYTLSVSHP